MHPVERPEVVDEIKRLARAQPVLRRERLIRGDSPSPLTHSWARRVVLLSKGQSASDEVVRRRKAWAGRKNSDRPCLPRNLRHAWRRHPARCRTKSSKPRTPGLRMMPTPRQSRNRGRERALKRKHPWAPIACRIRKEALCPGNSMFEFTAVRTIRHEQTGWWINPHASFGPRRVG